MTVQELINLAYQTATGKNKTLSPGNARYQRLLAIANMAALQWEGEPGVIWKTRCNDEVIGTLDISQTVYRLPGTIKTLDISKKIVIKKDGKVWQIPLVSYQIMRDNKFGATLMGWQVQFGQLTSEMDGGEIVVPAVNRLPKMESPSDEVLVDDPNWLVFMMAAEFVRNSRTKQNQYGNLIALAQSAMEGMKYRNAQHAEEIIREEIWP